MECLLLRAFINSSFCFAFPSSQQFPITYGFLCRHEFNGFFINRVVSEQPSGVEMVVKKLYEKGYVPPIVGHFHTRIARRNNDGFLRPKCAPLLHRKQYGRSGAKSYQHSSPPSATSLGYPPPHSAAILSEPTTLPISYYIIYSYRRLNHHALFRYPGHHRRCHYWHYDR